jgi:serine/threonine-protein kinase
LVDAHRTDYALLREIVPQVCDALAYAHGKGVVHRDIKPNNILLAPAGVNGSSVGAGSANSAAIAVGTQRRATSPGIVTPRFTAKITDFGISLLRSSQRLTREGAVLGGEFYMAPEQLHNPHEVDGRADLYALGVTMYEMLTGHCPQGNYTPASHLAVGVPAETDRIIAWCLADNPKDRCPSAEALKAALLALPTIG